MLERARLALTLFSMKVEEPNHELFKVFIGKLVICESKEIDYKLIQFKVASDLLLSLEVEDLFYLVLS